MRALVAAVVGMLVGSMTSLPPALAADLAAPSGPVILVVSGAVANTNAAGQARFDQAMLERIGVTTMATTTPWTEGQMTFDGVLARDLMKAVGATGNEAVAVALNDYKMNIPFIDLQRPDVLIAFRQNGRAISVRERGPLWIIYPVEPGTSIQTMEVRAKMVWQLKELQIR